MVSRSLVSWFFLRRSKLSDRDHTGICLRGAISCVLVLHALQELKCRNLTGAVQIQALGLWRVACARRQKADLHRARFSRGWITIMANLAAWGDYGDRDT